MPKKFKGENSKAVEAKARKAAAHTAEKERLDREKEDALWADDDKHNARKQQRKEEKEKKRLEQLEKKKELQEMHDSEMESMKGAKQQPAARLTRAQISQAQEKRAAEAAKAEKLQTQLSHDQVPLEENTNRLVVEGDEARTVEDAISVLSVGKESVDKHPEKRVKAAYAEFEERRLPVLKKENTNMRLSQLKQLLKKEWQKSPENPLNQRQLAYNAKS